MSRIIVDEQYIEIIEGTNLLQACLENNIYIPNLCYLKEREKKHASCRLCFVKIEGMPKPVTSCTVNVEEGMVISTDTPAVRRLQRTAFQLLMSGHEVDCAHCPANKKCELQKIARFLKLGLKPKGLDHSLRELETDHDHPFLEYFPHRCVLCGKCIFVCKKRNGRPYLIFAGRGLKTQISFFGDKDPLKLPCAECLACTLICPVAAIIAKTDT